LKPRLTAFLTALATVSVAGAAERDGDPLAAWRNSPSVRAVTGPAERHTIHAYFNTCPESPDGRRVLFFSSTTPDSHRGEVRMLDRASGKETVLATNINCEDAHRAACQQWASNGRRVVFHGERNSEWFTAAVDVDSGRERVLARGLLKGWGQPQSDLVPLYGPHWKPGEHTGLELLNVETGEIRKSVGVEAIKAAYPDWWAKTVGDKPVQVFFPILSPDLKRVFWKMATPGNGNPRSKGASERYGLICYSLEESRFLFMRGKWSHPAWHPDGRTIVEMGFTLFDSSDGTHRRVPGLPAVRGDHPSASPDGKLIVTDTTLEGFGGKPTEWGIVVADARGTNHVILHRFDNSRGARSWRRSHPHPVFSPDGRRIYFNVSSDAWTRLYVAEAAVAARAGE